MDTFGDFLPLLKRDLAQLEKKQFHLSTEHILDVLSDVGEKIADDAVRHYSATLLWPPVTDKIQFELCLRMRVAIWWIEDFLDEEREELYSTFVIDTMIDYWKDVGRRDWIWHHFCNPDVNWNDFIRGAH